MKPLMKTSSWCNKQEKSVQKGIQPCPETLDSLFVSVNTSKEIDSAAKPFLLVIPYFQ